MIGEYHTIKEVIDKLNISRATIYKLEKEKIITFKRLLGKVYIKISDIESGIK